jgi:hypothetical protein
MLIRGRTCASVNRSRPFKWMAPTLASARDCPRQPMGTAKKSQSSCRQLSVRGLEICCAVAEEARRRNRLRKDDAYGDENRAAARSKGHGDLNSRAFGILVAAAECDSALREVFADGDFFLKAAPADTGEDAGFDPCAIAARKNVIVLARTARG